MKIVLVNFVILISAVATAPQYPEINGQFEESNHTELQTPGVQKKTELRSELTHTEIEPEPNIHNKKTTQAPKELTLDDISNITSPEPNIITRIYKIITRPLVKIMSAPKVNSVLTNIGTCIVNGAMEIISFYFPAPLIPLIASAAGLIIPFEPVVMLKEKMPVASYRRAFKTAVKGFLGTFDRYKYEDEDPYMSNRFNRRFMGDKDKEDI